MLPIIAMAALSAAQYANQKEQENRQRQLAATTASLSPWTKMQPGAVKEADAVGTVGSGALAGWQMQQGMEAQDAQKNFQEQYLKNQQQYQNTMQPQQGMPMQGSALSYGPHQDPRMYQNQSIWPSVSRVS